MHLWCHFCIMCGHAAIYCLVCQNCQINLTYLIAFSNNFLQLAQRPWHGINRNLARSPPLSPPSPSWSTPPRWSENKKDPEVGSRGGEESSGPTTKSGWFSGRAWVSGRQSTWCQLLREEERDSQWIDLPSLGGFATSWARAHWSGGAQPLQESKRGPGRGLVLHHWPRQDLGTLHCS